MPSNNQHPSMVTLQLILFVVKWLPNESLGICAAKDRLMD